MNYLLIIAGAVVGAPLRYFIGSRVQGAVDGGFPAGTLAVNLIGCLVIGLVFGISEARDAPLREARLLVITGFLGAFTTFSAFGWETFVLLRDNDIGRAGLNVGASVIGGLLAVWLGIVVAKAAV